MADFKQHECDKMPTVGVHICYDEEESPRDKTVWQLFIQREATEQDVMEDHYLDMKGDIIWQTKIEISYCPYCGIGLYDKGHKLDADHGLFYHSGSEQQWK